jgi:hypothetical protein
MLEAVVLVVLDEPSMLISFGLNDPHGVGVPDIRFVAFLCCPFYDSEFEVLLAEPLLEVKLAKGALVDSFTLPCGGNCGIGTRMVEPDDVSALEVGLLFWDIL